MSPQRVLRSPSARPRSGTRPALWLAAAVVLPVVVAVVVLTAVTLAALVFGGHAVGDLAGIVAVEWLVLVHAPLEIDGLRFGLLPLALSAVFVVALAAQVRAAFSDLPNVGVRELGVALLAPATAALLTTGLACAVVGSAASDFAVREANTPLALAWGFGVGLVGGASGVWTVCRRLLRDSLPPWAIGGVRVGFAATAATWALGALLTTVTLLGAWGPIGVSLAAGRDLGGITALGLLSVAYLPNIVLAAATVSLGGEAHLGEASFSVFAVSRGRLPEVPLAAALPTTDPHPVVQGVLLLTALVAIALARVTSRWYDSIGDAVKSSLVAGLVVAVTTAAISHVAGGRVGTLGSMGTDTLVAAGLAFLYFGVVGAVTSALSLMGLARKRDRDRDRLERRRRAAARRTVAAGPVEGEAERTDVEPDGEPDSEPDVEHVGEPDSESDGESDNEPDDGPGSEAPAHDTGRADEAEREPGGPAGEPDVPERAADTDHTGAAGAPPPGTDSPGPPADAGSSGSGHGGVGPDPAH